MKFQTQHLNNDQYFHSLHPKRNIVLHHTVSSTAKSALTWWGNTEERVATAFLIDKDGTVINTFDPMFWAWHLGLRHQRNGELNRRSIGIEIVNEGPLWKHKDGSLRWLQPNGPKYIHPISGPLAPVPNEGQWRMNCQFWAAYTPQQYDALNDLIPTLLTRFNLPGTINKNLDYDKTLAVADNFTIFTHANVRADKSDLSPAFDFGKLNTSWQE